jgi:hypothetical protein
MRNTSVVCFLLLLAVALTPATTTGLSSSGNPPRSGRFGATLASGPDAAPSSGKLGWLLKSPYFHALSSAGKRAVLISAGQVPRPAPASRLRGGLTPSSSAGTGQPLENIRVNNPALDLTYHTHSDSTIATDGTYIAVGFDDDAGLGSGYAISSDGGQTFAQGAVPDPPLGIDLGDSALAFAPNGTLFLSSLALQEDTGVAVASSTDHGNTFSTPTIVSGAIGGLGSLQDSPSITVDQGATSPFKSNVYLSWATTGEKGLTISFTRSTDLGATFQAPVTLPAAPKPPDGSVLFFTEGPTEAVGPKGELYVFYYASYFGTLGSQILVVKSTDGGVTFGAASVVASFFTQESILSDLIQGEQVYTGGQFGVESTSYPQAVVDQSGNIGVVFEATSLSAAGPADPSNVFFTRSSDGGGSFSAPLQLNDDGGTTTQWRPSIAVTPSGVFGVKWFDRRSDPAHDSLTDVYMATSSDGGNTFSKNFRVTDTNWLFGEEDAPETIDFHGLYDTMAALGETFLCSWSDERSGKSDVYFTSVPASFDSASPDFGMAAERLYSGVVAGGAPVSVPINITSVNQSQTPIALSAMAPVAGLSFSFSPAQASPGQSAAIQISASGSTPPGLYIVPISGSAGGLVRTTNLSLTVFEPGHQAAVPVNATNTIGSTFQAAQSMTSDSSGNLHLCFLDDTASPGTLEIYYERSSDSRQTFTSPVLVGNGTSPEIGSGSSTSLRRKAKLAKDDKPKLVTSLASSPPSAAAPSTGFAPTTIYGAFTTEEEPAIAVDLAGNIYISVTTINIVDGRFAGQILIYKSTDGGKTFSAPAVAVTNSCNQEIDAQAIRTDKAGNIVLAYVPFCRAKNADGEVEASVSVVMSSDGGATFSAPQNVSGKDFVNALDDLPIRITFDSKGGLYVLYNASTGQFQGLPGKSLLNVRLAVAPDGVHFSPATSVYEVSLVNGAVQTLFFDPSTSAPDIVIDANDNIFVSVLGETPFGDDIYVMSSTNGGASFSAPTNITNSLDVTYLSPFADSAGNIGYLYTRGTLGIFEGRSSDGGKTFFQTENVSGHLPSVIDHTEIISDPSGNLYAYWGTTVGGSSDIYVCKFH